MRAELNFIRQEAVQPQLDLTRSDWRKALPLEPHAVDIEELPLPGDPAGELKRRGFTAVPMAGVPALDLAGDAWRTPLAMAIGTTLKQLTGCRGVTLSAKGMNVRRGRGSGSDTPVTVCHSDFTHESATRKFARLAHDQPKAQGPRFAAYNLWWLASAPPQDAPLALCDATTALAEDVVLGAAIYADPAGAPQTFGEIAFYQHSPRQRWFWYPELTPERLLVFAGHDSDLTFASQVPHSAFVNADCPPDAPTRVSIECRCLAYW
jgi:hypothetical protein